MTTKNILDIDAFSRGLMGVMNNSGVIIPLAAQQMIMGYVAQGAGGIPYASNLIQALTLSWQINTIVAHKNQ
jgi:hypothetical protein